MPIFLSYLDTVGGVFPFDLQHMQKSSTYDEPSVFGSKQFTVLFILILNSVVDRMLPCGTPCFCLNRSDKVEPTRTCIVRSARKLLIKLHGSISVQQ